MCRFDPISRTSQYWLSESSDFVLLLGLVSFTLAALVFLLLGASSTKPPSASYSSLAARLRESCFGIAGEKSRFRSVCVSEYGYLNAAVEDNLDLPITRVSGRVEGLETRLPLLTSLIECTLFAHSSTTLFHLANVSVASLCEACSDEATHSHVTQI